MAEEQRHQTIWLQPWCDGCEKHCRGEGRLWCPDDAWGRCDECGRQPVKYEIKAGQQEFDPDYLDDSR